MKTKVVQVLIHRSITSAVSDVVMAHEVPILKAIRGASKIEVTNDNYTKGALKGGEINPRNELIRLKQKYRGFVRDGQHPVDEAYPDGSRDLELFYTDPAAFDLVGEVEGGGSLEDEDPEAEEVEEVETNVFNGINLLDREAVTGALDQMEVPYAKTTATKHLATLLTNSVEEGANTAEQPE